MQDGLNFQNGAVLNSFHRSSSSYPVEGRVGEQVKRVYSLGIGHTFDGFVGICSWAGHLIFKIWAMMQHAKMLRRYTRG